MDVDEDGYRPDPVTTVASTDLACDGAGEGTRDDPIGDCDDADASVFPGATDVPDDGTDQDCNGPDAHVEDTRPGDSDPDTDTDTDGDSAETGEPSRRTTPGVDPKNKGCGSATPDSAGGPIAALAALILARRPRP